MKRFLRLTQEATYGTYASGGTAIYIRLDNPKSFLPMTTPQFWEVMSGSGFAVPALTGSQVTGLAATLTTPLHYSQWAFLMGGAFTRVNTGQTSPWTTGEAAGDLASFTADFGWSAFDGSIKRKRFLGCKFGAGSLSGSATSPVMRLSLPIIGSTPQGNDFDSSTDPSAVAFPEPADTSFPTDVVLFQHLRSGLTVGTSRTNFEQFSMNVASRVRPYFDESRFANAIRIGGRRTTWSVDFRLKASPNDRADFENAVLKSASFVFTNGTNTGTITCNSKNRLDAHDENIPLDEEIYYTLSGTNLLDASAGSDFTLTYA